MNIVNRIITIEIEYLSNNNMIWLLWILNKWVYMELNEMEIRDSSIVYLIDWTIQIKLLDFLFSETTRRECYTLFQLFMFESDFMNISSISIWDIIQLLVEMVISVSTTTIDWSIVMKEYFSCLDWLEWRIVWNTWLIVLYRR